MDVTLASIFSIAKDITLTGALVFALFGGYRGWWVFGWYHQKLEADRDEWKREARRTMGLANSAVIHAESVQQVASQVMR